MRGVAGKIVSVVDRVMYTLENVVASNPRSKFYMLGLLTVFFLCLYTILWYLTAPLEHECTWATCFYMFFQILAAGGSDDTVTDEFPGSQILFLAAILTGLTSFRNPLHFERSDCGKQQFIIHLLHAKNVVY